MRENEAAGRAHGGGSRGSGVRVAVQALLDRGEIAPDPAAPTGHRVVDPLLGAWIVEGRIAAAADAATASWRTYGRSFTTTPAWSDGHRRPIWVGGVRSPGSFPVTQACSTGIGEPSARRPKMKSMR